jgi:hypothetical protein
LDGRVRLPALFTGNRSKLGEVLVRTNVGNATKDIDLVEGFRLPSLFALKDTTGNFAAHKIGLLAHSPFYVTRLHTNQW